jgi:hypothetical protein
VFLACAVIVSLLSLALLGSAAGKLTKHPKVVESLGKCGVPSSWHPRLAAAEIACAVGMVLGLWVPALGVAAAVGVVLYFVGAVIAHVRVSDNEVAAPIVFIVLAVVVIVLRIATR